MSQSEDDIFGKPNDLSQNAPVVSQHEEKG
jgi:hypothetical protein